MKSLLKKRLSGGVAQAVAGQAVQYAARQHVGENKAIDVRLGAALLKDRRVAVGTKMAAVGIGVAAVMLLEVLDIPLEMLLAALLPILGIGVNFLMDGVEVVVGTLLVAAIALPHLAPKALVERLRAERNPVLVPVEVRR